MAKVISVVAPANFYSEGLTMSRIPKTERRRIVALALLLFIHSLVLESNEVVATGGFVSRVGVSLLPWLWGADALVTIFFSGVYSLVIDRLPRRRLTIVLFAGFGAMYALIFSLFALNAPEWVCYTLLMVANNQQWRLLPLLIYALANDLFSVCEAKRLFPLLGTAGILGDLAGNGLAASAGRWVSSGTENLLFGNALLTLAGAAILPVMLRGFKVSIRQSQTSENTSQALRAGLRFIRDVPSYRYLAPTLIVTGLGAITLEYFLLDGAARAYPNEGSIEAFYGSFKIVLTVLLLVMRSSLTGWAIDRLGFKSVFVILPAALLIGFLAALACPGLTGLVVGLALARLAIDGIDEPARQAFLGLVPEELRGRVGAIIDGHLQTFGCLLACAMLGGMTLLGSGAGQAVCCVLGCLCAGLALWGTLRFRAQYVVSLLNWRLQRRRRQFIPQELLSGFALK
jgi:ATP/ADP translocase